MTNKTQQILSDLLRKAIYSIDQDLQLFPNATNIKELKERRNDLYNALQELKEQE